MKHILTIAGITALVGIAGCGPATRTNQAGAVTVFRDVRVFDGAEVHERTTVVVRDGTIEAVAPDLTVPPGATIVEGEGRTLLPGLIDAHTHSGGFRRILEEALDFGVTTMLDMASRPANVAPLREEQETTGAPDRADLFSAGSLVTAPGGHGTDTRYPSRRSRGPTKPQPPWRSASPRVPTTSRSSTMPGPPISVRTNGRGVARRSAGRPWVP